MIVGVVTAVVSVEEAAEEEDTRDSSTRTVEVTEGFVTEIVVVLEGSVAFELMPISNAIAAERKRGIISILDMSTVVLLRSQHKMMGKKMEIWLLIRRGHF